MTKAVHSFILFLLVNSASLFASDELKQLQQESAHRYFAPSAHLALAKYHHNQGNRLLAFYLVEAQRRKSEDPAIFAAEFRKYFIDQEPFVNTASAESGLQKLIAANPKDAKLVLKLADIYISRSDWTSAKAQLQLALQLDPTDFTKHQALAEVLRREGATEAATKIESDFFNAYPESAEAFLAKIEPLFRDDPGAARSLLERALRLHPGNGELLFILAILQDSGADEEAPKTFERAARGAETSAHIQGWVGRYFLKSVKNRELALNYYLNAYFLDPEFYETEFAESRVRTINWELADEALANLIKNFPSGLEAALKDRNPVVVSRALDLFSKSPWQPKLLSIVLDLMGHDDTSVRWSATQLLKAKASAAIQPKLQELLTSSDLRKSGLAAYLAVPILGLASFPAMQKFLESDCELLRYDAVSALILAGDEKSLELLSEHKSRESHPRILEILTSRGL